MFWLTGNVIYLSQENTGIQSPHTNSVIHKVGQNLPAGKKNSVPNVLPFTVPPS